MSFRGSILLAALLIGATRPASADI